MTIERSDEEEEEEDEESEEEYVESFLSLLVDKLLTLHKAKDKAVRSVKIIIAMDM